MARRRYTVYNAATAALTAAPAGVATGTSIKTMLQLKPTTNISIIEWGYSFETVPTAAVKVELITTGTVNATVTAFAAGDVVKWGDAGGAASAITLATSGSGFTSTAEGSITTSRLLDYYVTWAQQFSTQWPLEREPQVVASDILRIRMTTATTINAVCWLCWEE
jgi:hypothetical protein